MYAKETATVAQRRQCRHLLDRIEVNVRAFAAPATVNFSSRVDIDRPTEPLAFCILGAFWCHKADRPDMGMLTAQAASIAGVGGWFGFVRARRLDARAARRESAEASMPMFTVTVEFRVPAVDLAAATDLAGSALEHLQDTFDDDGSLSGWRATAHHVAPGTQAGPGPTRGDVSRV